MALLNQLIHKVHAQNELDDILLGIVSHYRKITTLVHKADNGKLQVCPTSEKRFILKTFLMIVFLVLSWFQLIIYRNQLTLPHIAHALLFNICVPLHLVFACEHFVKRKEIALLFNSFADFNRRNNSITV